MTNSGIYKIINKTNGKVYIGQSTNIPQRISDHFAILRSGGHISKGMQVDWNSGHAFEWEVIEATQELGNRESYWIRRCNSTDPDIGYNARIPMAKTEINREQVAKALKVIIAKSPLAFKEASRLFFFLKELSQQRFNIVADLALIDPDNSLTLEDQELITSLIDHSEDNKKDIASFKLTRAERAEVERLAQGEGHKELSSFIRDKIGLVN